MFIPLLMSWTLFNSTFTDSVVSLKYSYISLKNKHFFGFFTQTWLGLFFSVVFHRLRWNYEKGKTMYNYPFVVWLYVSYVLFEFLSCNLSAYYIYMTAIHLTSNLMFSKEKTKDKTYIEFFSFNVRQITTTVENEKNIISWFKL